jgi:hypothetical protein
VGAPSKRARKVRSAKEFNVGALASAVAPPKRTNAVFSWSLDDIYSARNQQLAGSFRLPARLAESMRTDDALFVAYENRLAPQRCIRVELKAAPGARGASIAKEAEALFGQAGVGLHPDTLADIHGALVNHGVAFGRLIVEPRADGSRVDVALRHWPIEFVRWDAHAECFKTQVDGGAEGEIHHGGGEWVVFRRGETEPFKLGALLSACLVWARHAFAIRDWAKGSVSHGNVKLVGELPEGMALQDSAGELTAEASAMIDLLRAMASDDSPVGIRPAGAKTEIVANTSSAWQVWQELVDNAAKAAARIYLGTDGVLGSQGGAPGVDVTALFGVAATKVEGDLKCIERALDTGVIEPWCAMNFGDSSLAPRRRYLLPDNDADAARASAAERAQAFYAEIELARKNGFAVSQAFVDQVAKAHGIAPPSLPVEANKAPSIALAPADIARVVSVNEARASAGLGVLLLPTGQPDPDGRLTVEEYAAKKAAAASAPPAPSLRALP